MTPLLELRNVSASYSGARVIQDVSFEVIAGETLGVIGRNGAGKTTTLLSIFGVPPTVEGTILVEGRELSRKHIYEAASRGVSLVPQGKRIFPNLTVRENLEVGRASGRQSPWGLDEIMELFPNLAPALDRPGVALSGGEQQMLAIARALRSGPKVLLLDEPTEGLAPVIIDQLIGALRTIQESGTALVLVEQRLRVIQELASRFVALRKGTVVATGPISELSRRAVQELVAL